MVDSMYEPTPPKRLCLVNESSSPSFSELSVNNEQNTYSLRKKRQHSPIKSRLRIRALLDYGFEDPEANGIQPQKDGIQIEKRVTRSSNIENGIYSDLNFRRSKDCITTYTSRFKSSCFNYRFRLYKGDCRIISTYTD